MRYRSRTIDL